MCRKLAYLLIVVFVLAFGSVAQAGLFDPPLQNPSFESPVLDAWDWYSDDWILGERGSAYLENGSWEIAASDGINVWKLWSGANVWQQIGTWDPGINYAISLWVGRGHDESTLSVELWAGGDPSLVPTGLEDIEGPTGHYGQIEDTNGVGATLIAGADLIPTVDVGQSEWMTAILNTGSDFNAGDALWLRLVSTAPGGQATWIDLVEVGPATVGPVGYWNLDETAGAIAQDSSGNGYDGILSADPDPAPLWTTDPGRGNVLEFVPGLDYVDCGPGVSAGQDLTVALWINPADVELMRPISCFDGGDYSAGPGWFLMLRHDDWDGQVPPNAWFRITGGVDPETDEDAWNSGDLWIDECWAPGEWVHMAFTFDEDTDVLSGYINGELAGVTIVPESRGVASDTNPLIMGHGGGIEQYEGLMEEVYIYDVVLTQAEIWDLVYPIAIPVPNGSFEQVYRPGSTTITADLGGNWTNGVGPDTPMNGSQTADYSDGTTGTSVDVPGWINTPGWPPSYDWPVGCGSIAGQTTPPDGAYYYTANGSNWGNAQGGAIESDAPLTTVGDGLTYTVSMLANGPVTPVVLELLADGVPLTPSSSVDPNAPYEWEEFSRTYDAASLADHVGKSLTIRVGFGPDAVGTQSHIDAVSLSYVPAPPAPIVVPITIVNPGFEDPVLAEDDWTWGDVPGWTLVGGEATDIEGSGVWNVTSADFDPVLAPEGENVLYTEYLPEGVAKGVTQVLTETFTANADYMLTVEVGNSNYYYNGGYSIQLLAGGVVIAEDNDTLWPDYKTWATSTVVYTYDPAHADLVGQPLEIRLLNLELDKDSPPAGEVVGVEFDNVTLSYVSEPAG
ncbi:MAG: LamG-like jellyroll fold domain-containing protein [Planctomycetota bacterium]|jgi:hypothetical protein